MLDVNELKKYLEDAAYNITPYGSYIIYYDSQNNKNSKKMMMWIQIKQCIQTYSINH